MGKIDDAHDAKDNGQPDRRDEEERNRAQNVESAEDQDVAARESQITTPATGVLARLIAAPARSQGGR
jgi:hypothetical protein